MSFASNRFNALLGEEETEVDKLGNIKPIEKKNNDQPPTRREIRKTGQRQPAVSPPSRRGHRSNQKSLDVEEPLTTKVENKTERPVRSEGRKRQFDRHSGTGIHDNEKKINQGWGKAGAAELEGANDVLDPKDPNAAETRQNQAEEPEDNTKTLDEYLLEKKTSSLRLNEVRQPNEGVDDSQWKNAIVLEKQEDSYFSGKGSEVKLKNKVKKEKVYLEIDQPSHRSRDRGGRGGGRGGRGGRGQQAASVNLSDSKAFPTLGA